MNARMVVGATLVVGWAALVVATAIYDNSGPPAQLVRGAVANPDGLRSSAALNLAYAIAMSLFGVGLVAVTRGRGGRAAMTAACVTVAGMIGVAGEAVLNLTLSSMVESNVDQAVLVTLVERIAGNVLAVIVLAGVGIMIGPLLVMLAMWRAGRIPVWVPPLYFVAIATNVVNVPVTPVQLFASIPVLITAVGITRVGTFSMERSQ
jgi:hypothetical protein